VYPYEEALAKVKMALKDISAIPIKEIKIHPHNRISTLTVGYKKMKNLEIIDIPISESVNRVAAETVIPYPPGIPLLLQGEKITQDKVENLKRLIQGQAKFQGGSMLKQHKLKVFSEVYS
jgi:arginine/lysine/ornithine decarboxylase